MTNIVDLFLKCGCETMVTEIIVRRQFSTNSTITFGMDDTTKTIAKRLTANASLGKQHDWCLTGSAYLFPFLKKRSKRDVC